MHRAIVTRAASCFTAREILCNYPAMESPAAPAPHGWRSWLPRVLAESVLIVFSVLLALAVDEWREEGELAREVQEARTAFANEIRGNRDLLASDQFHGHHKRMWAHYRALSDAAKAADQARLAQLQKITLSDFSNGVRPTPLRDAVWRSFSQSGIVRDMKPPRCFCSPTRIASRMHLIAGIIDVRHLESAKRGYRSAGIPAEPHRDDALLPGGCRRRGATAAEAVRGGAGAARKTADRLKRNVVVVRLCGTRRARRRRLRCGVHHRRSNRKIRCPFRQARHRRPATGTAAAEELQQLTYDFELAALLAGLLVVPAVELEAAFDENWTAFLEILASVSAVRPQNVTSTNVTSSRFSPFSAV
jgi:hypothetical protein